jgi:hypothetical protein
MSVSSCIFDVRTIQHRSTWRSSPLSLTFIQLAEEINGDGLLAVYEWARERGLPNPRVICPSVLRWSSLFHPAFFHSSRSGASGERPSIIFPKDHPLNDVDSLTLLHLQSTLFLAYVTLSAAILQSRWSFGTLASRRPGRNECRARAERAQSTSTSKNARRRLPAYAGGPIRA